MVYESYAICPKCGDLDYNDSQDFKFCPDCGSKVKIVAHCLTCGREASVKVIDNHRCRCKKHNMNYENYGGIMGKSQCPECRKEDLKSELEKLSQ